MTPRSMSLLLPDVSAQIPVENSMALASVAVVHEASVPSSALRPASEAAESFG